MARLSISLAALWALAFTCAFGQSSIQTVLGGAPDGVLATVASLNNPAAVTCDANGNIFLALSGARQVVRIDSAGMVWLFAGN